MITQDGLEAATVRRIAAEVGYSTAVVTYYFANKNDLLLSAFRLMGERNQAKFDEFIATDPPDLLGYLLSMSALEPSDGSAWRACIAFWDRALRDPVFAGELRLWIGAVLDRVEAFLRVLKPGCGDPRRIATQLFDLVQGLSTHLLFDADCWTIDDIRETMAREISVMLE